MTTTMRTSFVLAACLLGFGAGCHGEPADYTDEIDPIGPTVREQLGGRQEFAIAPYIPERGGSFVSGEVGGDLAGEPETVALPVAGGHVTARALDDGSVAIEELVVDLHDVQLTPEQFPPNGLWLTGMQLRLADPITASSAWTEDDQAVVVSAALDLELDWGLVLSDGERHELATQTLRELAFQLDVGRIGPGGLELGLGAFAEGTVWHWASFVEVSNLSIDLRAQN
jgi:hypothetical protein